MALFSPEDFDIPDRTPNSKLIIGSEGSNAEQSGTKLVTRGGAGSAQADIDIEGHDVADTDFESDIRDIGGTSVLNFALSSDQGNSFEVMVDYYADDKQTVVRTWDSSVFPSLEGATVDTTVPVAGDLMEIRVTDTSGTADNNVNGSINANVGSSTASVDVDLQSEAVGINNSAGNRIDPVTAALEDALKSNDTDELISRIVNTSGSEIDPAEDSSVTSEQPRKKTLGSSGSYSSSTVGTSSSQLLASNSSRRSLLIQNLGSSPVYIGFDSSVETGDGIRLAADGGKYSDDTYTGAIYAISVSTGQDVRIQEVSD